MAEQIKKYKLWIFIAAITVIIAIIAKNVIFTGQKKNAPEQKIPSVKVFTLKKQMFKKQQFLPAEMLPYEQVEIFPKVEGYINKIYADRGSFVKKGDLLTVLIAPEMESRIAEAKSKVRETENKYAEAYAQYVSDMGVYERVAYAAQTPGVIAPNELEIAQMTMEASKAKAKSLKKSIQAYKNALITLQRLYQYLTIKSPIEGVVTFRNLHPGALVGPAGAGANSPIFRIEQLSRLRLVLPVPERYFTSVQIGDEFNFKVPAYPGKFFTAVVSRPSYALNTKYRTEYVELDYYNKDQKIEITPGMFTEVLWTVKRKRPTFVVPVSAIASTMERAFVIKIENNTVKWIDVTRGFTYKNKVEIFGSLKEGDTLMLNATDELQDGTKVRAHF